MARTKWADARLDDAFEALRSDIRELRADIRADIRQLWVTMVGGYVALIAALIATQL